MPEYNASIAIRAPSALLRNLLDAPTVIDACCGHDLCHKNVLYLYLYFWLSLAPPHSEYGAASTARAGIPDFERKQANVGKSVINLWPGDSVAHSAVLVELGLWRIETRHNMCALRLLRDILVGDPPSQLCAIYNTCLQCCEALEWPTGSWYAWIREIITPIHVFSSEIPKSTGARHRRYQQVLVPGLRYFFCPS